MPPRMPLPAAMPASALAVRPIEWLRVGICSSGPAGDPARDPVEIGRADYATPRANSGCAGRLPTRFDGKRLSGSVGRWISAM